MTTPKTSSKDKELQKTELLENILAVWRRINAALRENT